MCENQIKSTHYPMKKISSTLFVLFFLVCNFSLNAQNMKVTGTVFDTTGTRALPQAMVMAVRVRDSLLLSFTRTNNKGEFTLTNFKADTFSLVIAHPNFDDKTYYIFGNKDNFFIDIPVVKMPAKLQNIEEVVIYANKNPIYFKGDTLVYVADSFKVNENAVVEDLLKKLPGLKVDKEGKITSQGKEIGQVLVDGDEFFGSDPTIATKNLGAKGVESVQVYEKKNENAKEGEEETIQVLNLKLKDDAKKGYFGKISGASDFGLENRKKPFYEGELLLNKFDKSQKISVFALGANTPRSNFKFGDMAKFGLENERNSSGMSMWNQGGQNTTTGVPQTIKAGIYFNDKIGKTGKIGFNYSYYNNQLDAFSSSRSQYFLSDSSYYTSDSTRNSSKSESHRVKFNYSVNLDSLTFLEIKPSLNYDLGSNDNLDISTFLGEDEIQSMKTSIGNSNASKGVSTYSEALLLRKFKRPKRELEFRYVLSSADNNTDEKLYTLTEYANFSALDTIDQSKTNNNSSSSHVGTVAYTEPFGLKYKVQLEYMYEYGFSNQNKEAFNKVDGAYNQRVDLLSNNFENLRQQNRVTLEGIYETRKVTAKIGLGLRNIAIENLNIISNVSVNQNITNFLPRASYQFKPSQSLRFTVNYITRSSQPSINDLQPVPDNTNPNRVKEGNPDLKPNYVHQLNVNFNTWKALTGQYIWSGASVSLTDNAFANSTEYDAFGRTISKTVNVDGNIYSTIFAGAGFPVWGRKIEIAPNINGSYNRYTNFITTQVAGQKVTKENVTENTAIDGGLTLEFVFDSLEFSIGNNYSYTNPVSSLNSVSNKPYTTQEYTASVDWTLPFHFKAKSEVTYSINSNLAAGYNLSIFLWNAEISKAFMKTENLIISLNGNDILNQNKRIQREVNGNVITDNNTKIISRYFLLKVTYKFNKNKTKEADFSGWH